MTGLHIAIIVGGAVLLIAAFAWGCWRDGITNVDKIDKVRLDSRHHHYVLMTEHSCVTHAKIVLIPAKSFRFEIVI